MIEQNQYNKIVQNSDGTHTIEIATEPISYQNSAGEWCDVDRYIEEPTETGVRYSALPFIAEIDTNKTGYTLTHRVSGEFWRVELVELGGVPLEHHPDDDDIIEWFYDVSEQGVRLWKEIKKGSTLREAKWKVTHSPNPTELYFREFVDAFDYDEVLQSGLFAPILIDTHKEEISETEFFWYESWDKDNLLIDTDVVIESQKGTLIYNNLYYYYYRRDGFLTSHDNNWGGHNPATPAASFSVPDALLDADIHTAHIYYGDAELDCRGLGLHARKVYLWRDTTQMRSDLSSETEYHLRHTYDASRHMYLRTNLGTSGNIDCTEEVIELIEDPAWGGIVTFSAEGIDGIMSCWGLSHQYHTVRLHVNYTPLSVPIITTVNDSEMGTIAPPNPVVDTGTSQLFAITANTGYDISEVYADGIAVGPVSSYTVHTNYGDEFRTLHAEFSPPVSIVVDLPCTTPDSVSIFTTSSAMAGGPTSAIVLSSVIEDVVTFTEQNAIYAPTGPYVPTQGGTTIFPAQGLAIRNVLYAPTSSFEPSNLRHLRWPTVTTRIFRDAPVYPDCLVYPHIFEDRLYGVWTQTFVDVDLYETSTSPEVWSPEWASDKVCRVEYTDSAVNWPPANIILSSHACAELDVVDVVSFETLNLYVHTRFIEGLVEATFRPLPGLNIHMTSVMEEQEE